MEDFAVGINEDGLRSLSLEIEDYVDRISGIFGKIDNRMNQLPTCYEGWSCSSIMEHYRQHASSHHIIKNNILSYSEDLIELIRKMQDASTDLVSMFEGFTSETEAEAKKVKVRNQGGL